MAGDREADEHGVRTMGRRRRRRHPRPRSRSHGLPWTPRGENTDRACGTAMARVTCNDGLRLAAHRAAARAPIVTCHTRLSGATGAVSGTTAWLEVRAPLDSWLPVANLNPRMADPTPSPAAPPPAVPAPAAASAAAALPVTGAFPVAFDRHRVEAKPTGKRLAILSLTALGVVYGDIGTCPLYALKECFAPAHGLAPTPGERARRPVAGLLVADPRGRSST